MRIFLIIAILIGIACPAVGIYAYEHQSEIVNVPYNPTYVPILTVNFVVPTPSPTLESTIVPMPIIIPTPVPTATPFTTPLPSYSTLHTPYLLNREEVKIFMLHDQTDKIPYTAEFLCIQFADTVVNNARSIGITASSVIVTWANVRNNHAIVVFPTVEDGEVYVDATCGDWWVDMEYGQGNYDSYSMTDDNWHWYYDMTLAGS
jgi:hypothetical protein